MPKVLRLCIDIEGIGDNCVAVGDALDVAVKKLTELRSRAWAGEDAEQLMSHGIFSAEGKVLGSWDII